MIKYGDRIKLVDIDRYITLSRNKQSFDPEWCMKKLIQGGKVDYIGDHYFGLKLDDEQGRLNVCYQYLICFRYAHESIPDDLIEKISRDPTCKRVE